MSLTKNISQFVDNTLIDLGRQFRWSYLPPLMIYVAAGISGLTGIVGVFFIKDYLNLSAAFLAGLGFWVGIPWALKMPLGHLVDLIWSRKNYLVFVGAGLIVVSVIIMYSLIVHTETMASILKVETWFVLSALLSPVGYVVQDVVADAMTVEAVPSTDDKGIKYPPKKINDYELAMCLIKSKKGVICMINNSRHCSYGYDQRIEVFGNKGMVVSGNRRDNASEKFLRSKTEIKRPLLNFFIDRYEEAYKLQLDDLIDLIQKRKNPRASFEEGRKAIIIANAASKSLKSKKFVKIYF